MLPGPLIPQIAPGNYSTRETIAHNFALRTTNPHTIALQAIRQPGERHIPGSKRPRKPASQRKKPPPDRCAFCACGSDGGFCSRQLLRKRNSLRMGALRGEQQRQGQDGYHAGRGGKGDGVGNVERGDADEHADEVRNQPHDDAKRKEAAARLLVAAEHDVSSPARTQNGRARKASRPFRGNPARSAGGKATSRLRSASWAWHLPR